MKPDARTAQLRSGGSRQVRLDALVQEVAQQGAGGVAIDFDALVSKHADLMPELGERLQTLRAITAAALRAQHVPADELSEEAALREELQSLRGALPGYELLSPLRYGAQGAVFKAVQKGTGRVVAIKVLLDGLLASVSQRRRFEREIALIGRLRHPNIVALFESGAVGRRPYFSMEYIEGFPLDDYVLVHPLNARATVALMLKVCRALSFAHQRGIIHRDLKPAHILMDLEGEPHVLDFGLARDVWLHDGDAPRSLAGVVIGTLPYLSPEQARGDSADADVRSDIYALGLVLYELLTGCLPYTARGPADTVRRAIIQDEPATLRQSQQQCPERAAAIGEIDADLEAIVLRTLAKAPEARYQSAAALADDLERYLRGDAVEARAEQRFYLLRKALRRYRLPAIVAAGFVGLLLVSLAGMTYVWQKAARVAAVSQTALQMNGYLRMGELHRSENRLLDAAAMFKTAVELGNELDVADDAVLQLRFDANDLLAQLLYKSTRPREAEVHSAASIQLAARGLAERPDSADWLRRLGAARATRGDAAVARGDWTTALAEYQASLPPRERLVELELDSSRAQLELSGSHGSLGRCYWELHHRAEALTHYQAAHAILQRAVELAPQDSRHIVQLATMENMLGVFQGDEPNAAARAEALNWLRRAEARLNTLSRAQMSEAGYEQVEILHNAIRRNMMKVERARSDAGDG